MFRAEPGFAHDHRWSLPVRNRLDRTNLAVSDRIDARSSSHLLIDESLSKHQLQNRAAEPNRMPREQILPGLDEHDSRDFHLASDPAIDIPAYPLIPHLFPQPTDGIPQRAFPGPTHVHVATLILDVLADDIAAQPVTETMARLIRFDPDDQSPMQGLPLRAELFLANPEASSTFPQTEL